MNEQKKLTYLHYLHIYNFISRIIHLFEAQLNTIALVAGFPQLFKNKIPDPRKAVI